MSLQPNISTNGQLPSQDSLSSDIIVKSSLGNGGGASGRANALSLTRTGLNRRSDLGLRGVKNFCQYILAGGRAFSNDVSQNVAYSSFFLPVSYNHLHCKIFNCNLTKFSCIQNIFGFYFWFLYQFIILLFINIYFLKQRS